MAPLDPILITVVGGYTLTAAVLDYRTQKIPNWLTVPAAVLGVLYHCFAPAGQGWMMGLAGLAVGFALLLLPFLLGGGGAGDVKMLAGLGAWMGPLTVAIILGIAAGLGTFMTLSVLTYAACSVGFSTARRQYNIGGAGLEDGRPRKIRRALPFVVPIAMASWMVLGYWIFKSQVHM